MNRLLTQAEIESLTLEELDRYEAALPSILAGARLPELREFINRPGNDAYRTAETDAMFREIDGMDGLLNDLDGMIEWSEEDVRRQRAGHPASTRYLAEDVDAMINRASEVLGAEGQAGFQRRMQAVDARYPEITRGEMGATIQNEVAECLKTLPPSFHDLPLASKQAVLRQFQSGLRARPDGAAVVAELSRQLGVPLPIAEKPLSRPRVRNPLRAVISRIRSAATDNPARPHR